MSPHDRKPILTRRGLLVSAGLAAAAVGVFKFGPAWKSAPSADVEMNNWVIVTSDNRIIVRVAQMELGQGAMTAMVQLLAEELAVDWSTIRAELIDLSQYDGAISIYGRTETSAGVGVRESELPLRTAGAQIRMMLLSAASQRLNMPVADLVAENGVISTTSRGASITYAEVAGAAAQLPVPDAASIQLKDPSNWRFVGHSMPRLDIPGKVDGSARFGIDTVVEGLKHAAIAMCPNFGGALKSYDAGAAAKLPGIIKVLSFKDSSPSPGGADNAVAVVADTWWQARAALDAMDLRWEGGSDADDASIMRNLRAGLDGPAEKVLRADGNIAMAFQNATQVFQAEYFVPYLDPAPLEPMNCTAVVTKDAFEVWAPTQHPEDAIRAAAATAGLPVSSGRLNTTLSGGAYGRRIPPDFVIQAVAIAKEMKGVPVKLLWSREDCTAHSFYRQASLARLRGSFASDQNLSGWEHRIAGQSADLVHATLGADTILYAVPNLSVDYSQRASDVPEGSMRGVGYSITCFAIQSFLSELAHSTETDPYLFQRNLLDPAKTPTSAPMAEFDDDLPAAERASRLRAVLDQAADKADWHTPRGFGQGRGIAAIEQSGAFYAGVVEVSLDNRGGFTVDRVVVAGDPGRLANPRNAESQVQGCVAYGLSSAIHGEITLRNGAVVEQNFSDYPIIRLDEMPAVEIYWILDRPFFGDVSQAAVSLMAPALANAIFDAGGPRIRSLPIGKHKLVRREA